MSPKLTAVTLGVPSVPESARFYEALGFKRKVRATGDEIAFYQAGGVVLALWDWNKLADDAVVPASRGRRRFAARRWPGTARRAAEVDAVFAHALKVGGRASAQAGEDGLRRLSRLFLRSGRPCLGGGAGAGVHFHRRRTADPAGLRPGFPRHSQRGTCRI